ncbi:MAG: alkaline phosphatase family protein, partial [Bdellovibrionota bacterium]
MRLKPHPCWAALAAILLTNLTYAAPRPAAHAAGGAGTPRPKLIFMIVIDQFRADYLTRFEKRFLPPRSQGGDVGGFRYLMTQGAYYPFAQYDLLQSMTCPGHATVLTGAYPYQAGIPANDWFDPETLQRVYCAEDPTQATVGAETTDPHLGTSPKNLIADTVGDELKNAGIPSRVVTVALKDRAAIMMGGHRADLALWMDPGSHHWVSSKFYLPDGKLPGWVVHLNETLDQHKGEAITWDYPGPGSGLSTEKYFPHKADFGTRESMAMPLGVDLTETAAERAFEAFKLGQGAGTDLFAVSFSSHDYVGHQFGPNSREMEEMTVAEDFAISQLLNMVREKVPGGLKNTVVILTGDHGIPPIPETAQA